jgi:hypothetical protein
MRSSGQRRTKVFISYSHQDAQWLRRLQAHIRPLERDYDIQIWDDTKIEPGSNWRENIKKAIESAKVAVLLISADFLASDFIAADELPPLLEAARTEGAIILPVILSPSGFSRTKILSQFQAINDPSKPVIDLSKGEQERVFAKVADYIEKYMNPQGGAKSGALSISKAPINIAHDEQEPRTEPQKLNRKVTRKKSVVVSRNRLDGTRNKIQAEHGDVRISDNRLKGEGNEINVRSDN